MGGVLSCVLCAPGTQRELKTSSSKINIFFPLPAAKGSTYAHTTGAADANTFLFLNHIMDARGLMEIL